MRFSSSSFLLVAAVLTCSASVVLSRPTASASASVCGYGGLDFSSLAGLDIVGSDGSTSYSYLLSICGALTSSQATRCLQISPQSAACQNQLQQGQAYDIGNWNAASAPTWSYIDPAKPASGVQYTMTGAQSCWATGQPQAYSAVVQFVCAAKQMPLTVSVPQGSCVQTYTLHTPLACSGPAPAPKCGASLGGNTYDFSSLMGTDLVGYDGSQTYEYFTSVCGDLSSSAASSCLEVSASASACQLQVQGGTGTFVTGEWPGSNEQVEWEFIDVTNPQRGVQVHTLHTQARNVNEYTLQGAQSCWATGSLQPYTVNVQFQCAAQQALNFTVSQPQGSCVQTYTLETPHGCAGGVPPTPVKCGTTLDGVTFDFSSLAGVDITGSDGTSPPAYVYNLNVCGVLSSPAAAPCLQIEASASACQRQLQGGMGVFDLGNWVSADQQWSWVDPNNQLAGVQYTMIGAQQCWAHPPVEQYVTQVQFICGNTPSPLSFTASSFTGSCVTNLTISTPLVCGKNQLGDRDDQLSLLF